VTRTIVQPGSTVSGTVDIPEACETEALPLWLWLHNDRASTVRVTDLRNGDSYRIGGLPPGQHTLGAHGNRTTVTVGGGETVTRDVTFACDQSPLPSPSPSSTPSPPGPPPPSATSSATPTGSDPAPSSTGETTPDAVKP
jgi:hypothetical protein